MKTDKQLAIKTTVVKNNKSGLIELAKVMARRMAEEDFKQRQDKAA